MPTWINGKEVLDFPSDGARRAGIDGITNALRTINYVHHEIHGGSHYYLTMATILGVNATTSFLVQVPASNRKWIHMEFLVSSSLGSRFRMYEGASVAASGTAIATHNSNRNHADDAIMKVFQNPSFGADGTMIYDQYLGGALKSGGEVRDDSEIILQATTNYKVLIQSQANTNYVSIRAEWYEHTNID